MEMCSFAIMIFWQAVLQTERSSTKVAFIRYPQALHTTYFSLTIIAFHTIYIMQSNVLKISVKDSEIRKDENQFRLKGGRVVLR